MDRKYEFTGEVMQRGTTVLRRILAVRDFGTVVKGALGGWIEKEGNLSHDGLCWISDDAWVYGGARVYGDAQVFGDAWVYGTTKIFGSAKVYGTAEVHGNARVCDVARVCGLARVCDFAQVYGAAKISGDAQVFENAQIYGDAHVYGDARICGDALVYGDSCITGGTWDHSPLYVQGSRDPARWSAPGILDIGCESRPIGEWLVVYRDVGTRHRYSPEQIEEYRQIIELFAAAHEREGRTKPPTAA